MQEILQGKPVGKVLVQMVVAAEEEQGVLAGLSGLLKTAGLENPQLQGQVILIGREKTAEELAHHLETELGAGPNVDLQVRYGQDGRQVLSWQEIEAEAGSADQSGKVFQETGVYLITGGSGGLGLMFAQEILNQTQQARVVLSGRSAWSAEKQKRIAFC